MSTRERPARNRYIIAASDRESFKQCRRAWDFSAKVRQNYEPTRLPHLYDFEAAILEGLSLYYYPGMWDWNRQIVHPIAVQGFTRSMQRQRSEYCGDLALSSEEEQEWSTELETGKNLLIRYMDWAPSVDHFAPIRVELPFKVHIADPRRPGSGMLGPGGGPIEYHGRAHVLVADADDAFWVVRHRVAPDWLDPGFVLLDEEGLALSWALQELVLVPIKGVMYNELRRPLTDERVGDSDGLPEGASRSTRPKKHRFLYRASSLAGIKAVYEARRAAGAESRPVSDGAQEHSRVEQQGNDLFRRTQVWISQARIKDFGKRLALEVLDMTDPNVRIYPNPTIENCSRCRFAVPCMAVNDGLDASTILETPEYRQRPEAESQEGRVGAEGFRGATAAATMPTGRPAVYPHPLGWSLPTSHSRRAGPSG